MLIAARHVPFDDMPNDYPFTAALPNDDELDSEFAPRRSPTVTIAQLVHPYQAAGLGTAPFECLGAAIGDESCRYCGRAIKNVFTIKSHDGKVFAVGSECVNRVGAASVTNFEIKRSVFESQLRRDRKAAKTALSVKAWRELNRDEAAFIDKNAAKDGFLFAMSHALAHYGSLTDNQLNAVRASIKRAADRAAGTLPAQVAAKQREEQAQVIDIGRIETAFKTAIGKGLKNPKLSLARFTFLPAKSSSANAGAIYVKLGRAYEAPYLGKVVAGKFIRSRDCTLEAEAEILKVCAAPDKAAEAYGRLTGNCAVCMRPLTAKESVARAIGPICAERFGW